METILKLHKTVEVEVEKIISINASLTGRTSIILVNGNEILVDESAEKVKGMLHRSQLDALELRQIERAMRSKRR